VTVSSAHVSKPDPFGWRFRECEKPAGCAGFSGRLRGTGGCLLQGTFFQGIATDFNGLLGIVSGLHFDGVLAIDVAHLFVPDPEFVVSRGQIGDGELSVSVRNGCVGMVNRQPVGIHPWVEVTGNFEWQDFGSLDGDFLAAAFGCCRGDQHIGACVLERIGVGVVGHSIAGNHFHGLSGSSDQSVRDEKAVLLVKDDGGRVRGFEVRMNRFRCLGQIHEDVGQPLVGGIDDNVILEGISSSADFLVLNVCTLFVQQFRSRNVTSDNHLAGDCSPVVSCD